MGVKGYSNDRASALRVTKAKLDFINSNYTFFLSAAKKFLVEKIEEINEPKNRQAEFNQDEMKWIEMAYECTMEGHGMQAATNLPRRYRPR